MDAQIKSSTIPNRYAPSAARSRSNGPDFMRLKLTTSARYKISTVLTYSPKTIPTSNLAHPKWIGRRTIRRTSPTPTTTTGRRGAPNPWRRPWVARPISYVSAPNSDPTSTIVAGGHDERDTDNLTDGLNNAETLSTARCDPETSAELRRVIGVATTAVPP
jgi:hypothetical protein